MPLPHRVAVRARRGGTAIVLVAMLAALGALDASHSTASERSSPTPKITTGDWSGYLHDAGHSSYSPTATEITPANVSRLAQRWRWRADTATMPGQSNRSLFASPIVADGSVYIGSNNGYFYQLNETTGAVLHKVFLGFRPKLTCNAPRGFVSTATVATDPADGQDTVYVASPDGYLYALRAADLSLKWRSVVDLPSSTVSDYFNWSSPTVANGKIYLGSASQCDKPLTRGSVVGFDQRTGNEFARFYTVPDGYLGGGVWSSIAVADDGSVFASTGTQPGHTRKRFDAVSIVHLDGATLQKLGGFTVPDAEIVPDDDFGGSPTIFGSHVGACNKNGYYYALNRSDMSLAWKIRVGEANVGTGIQCAAAAVYDGSSLYIAGDPAVINGVSYRGSLSRIDPNTGAALWQLGLPNSVLGSPSMNGGGLIAVSTYDTTTTPNAVYLVNAATGQIVRTVNTGGRTFAQVAFANGWLFTANVNSGLKAYHLR